MFARFKLAGEDNEVRQAQTKTKTKIEQKIKKQKKKRTKKTKVCGDINWPSSQACMLHFIAFVDDSKTSITNCLGTF